MSIISIFQIKIYLALFILKRIYAFLPVLAIEIFLDDIYN